MRGLKKEVTTADVYKMPREMADVLDRIVKEYGQRQGINSRDELISGILSAFLAGAAEDDNDGRNNNLVGHSES